MNAARPLQTLRTVAASSILLAVLWAGAESHDSNCYSKATIRASASLGGDQPPARSHCLILPWNKP
jgi:hypothetical protein